MWPINFDEESFLVGLQLGRRIKVWDAYRNMDFPTSGVSIITEKSLEPILTEDGVFIITE